ncbi:glycosyl hydrolase family 8 [Lentzea atacamensis]|uniref:Glycosyl hydrolase family 8 n=1 Tax=Lentzea atacamensis TaxID=531938 RepID=A0A316I438_9PSEU|nr:glycosyl hydrolase family 8 [Lentzea atacamensis]PWK88231.1 glycosyl hydrolase family 8 [Lentzea atacamensis]
MGRRSALGALAAFGLVLGLVVAGMTSASAADPLVSRGKTVLASSIEGSGFEAAKAVDGSTSTRWASVEGHDPEWLRVDLGSTHSISRVKLNWEVAYARAYRVQTSPDGSAWSDIFSTTTGDGAVDDLTVSGSGRYVRVYGTARGTPYGYSLWELEIYGVAGGTTPPTTTTTTPPTPGIGYPFGSRKQPYAAGILRPSGSTSTLDAAVVDYYQRWKSAFLRHNCNSAWSQVLAADADHDYVAEAQGYGMVIVATMAGADPDAKRIFDGFVKWKIDHPSVIDPDLMAAEQDDRCVSVNGGDAATDGDMDVAYGLLLADRQWGSAGTYNYKELAIRHINAIKRSEINPTTKLLRPGDWATSSDPRYYVTRSSDWMADHFRAFRKATGDSAWDTIRTAHQNLITRMQQNFAPGTGLLPDFVENTNSTPRPPAGKVLEDELGDGKYWWNACRVPWRIGADAVTSGDPTSLAAARKLNSWVKSKTGGNPGNIRVGYQLNGTQLSSEVSAAYTAPFAVAAATDSGSQAWLDALWNKMLATPIGGDDYFASSIQLQVMITVTGNHWVP